MLKCYCSNGIFYDSVGAAAGGTGTESGDRWRSNISRISFGSVPAGTVTVPVCVNTAYEYHRTFFSATRGVRKCFGGSNNNHWYRTFRHDYTASTALDAHATDVPTTTIILFQCMNWHSAVTSSSLPERQFHTQCYVTK